MYSSYPTALAEEARNPYRLLEKRREECIIVLHQVEGNSLGRAARQTISGIVNEPATYPPAPQLPPGPATNICFYNPVKPILEKSMSH